MTIESLRTGVVVELLPVEGVVTFIMSHNVSFTTILMLGGGGEW